MKRPPDFHIALWPRAAYRCWGVWLTRASCRAGDPPAALAYYRDGLAAACKVAERFGGSR